MTESSIILAMKTVHVTSDAKARPTITAFTMMSADMNIDHGDSSRSATVVDFNDLLPLSAGVAVASDAKAAGADGATADGAGACTVGAACAGIAGGCGCASAGACCGAGAACCCADEGCASDSIASAKIKPEIARKGDIFILRPGSGSFKLRGLHP